jgi:uncharacterized protein YbaP (TraB family)
LNRHKDWVAPMLKKLEQGGVFIAVGANHVIPEAATGSVGTLLEEFEKHGVEITPIQTCSEMLLLRPQDLGH